MNKKSLFLIFNGIIFTIGVLLLVDNAALTAAVIGVSKGF